MKIESYSFGSIVVDGQRYSSDVLICGDEVKADWWRERGHRLQMKDLDWVIKRQPEVLVVGKGARGVMSVPQNIKEELESRGIKVIVERTAKACQIYNELHKSKKVAAALHLTC